MSLIVTVTNAGYAALAAAQAGGTGPLTIAKVGVSPTAITPLPTMTALAGETKRITTISGIATDPKTTHITVADESTDAYTVKSFALYLTDGTVFALYGQADALITKTAQSLMQLAIDIAFAAVASAALTFGNTNFLNPAATEVTAGVMPLATNAEASAGTVANKAITPKTLAFTLAAWLVAQFSNVWRSTNDGAGSGLDADLLDGQQGAYYGDIPSRLGYTPANKAGETFDGPIKRDANFFLHLSGTNPYIQFDAGDYILFDRVNNRLSLLIGSSTVVRFDSNGNLNVTGDILSDGNTVWHAGNDGTGSGLDAGLLGGQLPAYYTSIIARLGYTPLNQTAYTAADVLSKLLTVDGAGSGVDADLLDGQQASFYTAITARLGYTPLNQTAYTAADVLTKLLTVDGSGSGIDADLLDGKHASAFVEVTDAATVSAQGIIEIATNAEALAGTDSVRAVTPVSMSYTLSQLSYWRAGNDGAGSGMDADLLDGQHGSYYLPASSYSASDIKAKLVTVDGSGSGLDADLLDGIHLAALVQKANVMTDFAAAMALSWVGAFGPNSFYLGNLLVQTGIVSTIGANGIAAINFPTHYTSPPFVIPIRRTSGAVTNADSGVGIEGTPTLAGASVRNTTAGATIDVMWIAIGPA